jgi:hypothetical protein
MAYDWNAIKRGYVQGIKGNTTPTIPEICEHFGCTISTTKKRCARENWQQERNLFGTKKELRIEEKRLDVLVEDAADFDNKALNIAKKGLKKVDERLEDIGLSNHDLLKLSSTANNFQKMGKLALGEPTEHIKEDSKQTHDVNIHDRINAYEEKFKVLDGS